MSYRIRETGEYLATSFALRDKFKGKIAINATITEQLLEDIGVDPVLEGAQASGGTVYQFSQFAGLEQTNGVWFTKYILGPTFSDTPATETTPAKTAAENEAAYKALKDAEQAKAVRESRDSKLSDCDWVVIKSLELNTSIPAAWATYRQALRDVPTQTGFPWTTVWPSQPE